MGDTGLVRGTRSAPVCLGVPNHAATQPQNVAQRAEIALAVFDSTVQVGSASAVYVEAAAAQVPDHELAAALAVFNAKCEASGLSTWDESKVSGDSPHRLYLATASQVWVLDEHENRVPVL